MLPDFDFTDTVPAAQGRTYIDQERAGVVIDALLEQPNRWARIPITYLFPELEGADDSKLKNKARSTAARIQKHTLHPFNEYRIEAKTRGTDVYIRICMTRTEMRDAGYDDE